MKPKILRRSTLLAVVLLVCAICVLVYPWRPYQIVYSRPVSDEIVPRGKVLVFGLDRPLPAGVSVIPKFVTLESSGHLVEGKLQIMSDRKTFAFISSNPFAPDTQFRIDLRKGTCGLPLKPYSFVFRTYKHIGDEGPFIMTTTPLDGNINVSREITISSYWSEPLDESKLGASSVTMINSLGNQMPLTVSYNPFWHRLDIILNANLGPSSKYRVSLSPAIQNLRGQPIINARTWSFTTIGEPLPIPASGPYVKAITPAHLARNISTKTVVEVVWSEGMNAATLNSTTCRLTKSWNDEEVPTTLAYSSDSSRLTVTPRERLAENTAYILRFTDGVQNTFGLAFSQHKEWEGYFRTGMEDSRGEVIGTRDPGWKSPGPGGPGIGFPPISPDNP